MRGDQIRLGRAVMTARASGVLYWPAERVLVAGDLHLGRSERMAREGALLPPYETEETLNRLEREVLALDPRVVICLGDSFDDLAAANGLAPAVAPRIARLKAGRRWIWIAGNHDPGPVTMPGEHRQSVCHDGVLFRHIAGALDPDEVEVSAHYHPKARLCLQGMKIQRPCFLTDRRRAILPAFGTYTGGLDIREGVLRGLVGPDARALLTGAQVRCLSLKRIA